MDGCPLHGRNTPSPSGSQADACGSAAKESREDRRRFELQHSPSASVSLEPFERLSNDRLTDCLWVTELEGRVVGMIGLAHCKRHIVRICRFRVDPAWQHTAVVRKLIHCVHDYCCDRGCLKVLVEVGGVPQWMLASFNHHGFHLMRRKVFGDHDMLEFYVDLYYRPPKDD